MEDLICPHCHQLIPFDEVLKHVGMVRGKRLAKSKGPEYMSQLGRSGALKRWGKHK